MLPAHLAENIRKQVLFYLQSTFDFSDKRTGEAFLEFLENPDSGIFKGPWAQLRRPFRPADKDAPSPFDITKPFDPYIHQLRAWNRLTSKDHKPEHTIVTTGTGSGKTECFLYPILDHCLRERKKGQKGIKAIILYPMNALASDQERRFAQAVWRDPQLKGAGIRVGNYTGRFDPSDPGAGKDSGAKEMGKDHGITNHGVQQENPPDILLTNYKMLDFLLMRPQDQNLWRFNEPGVMHYLVLDELHTYDGAQGSDVACLIRRLKERLAITRGGLCVVGTSATLDNRCAVTDKTAGTGPGTADTAETAKDKLADFAGKLFEEDIPVEAVITEDRLEVEEIVHPDPLDIPLPAPDDCRPADDDTADSYARRQSTVWGGPTFSCQDDSEEKERNKAEIAWALDLGAWLKRVKLFRYILDTAYRAELNREDPLLWGRYIERVSVQDLGFASYDETDRSVILGSFFALIASAMEMRGGKAFPLLPTQVQIWLRELTRVGRVVSQEADFAWLDEPRPGTRCLPAFHCSECGESGWISVHDPAKDALIGSQGVTGYQLLDTPRKIYENWFHAGKERKSPYAVVISPWTARDETREKQKTMEFVQHYLCSSSLVLREGDGPCPLTGESERFRVKVSWEKRQTEKYGLVGDQGCPHCGSKVGVMFIGCQSATLSSLIIDEMFGSSLNSDPKLLAFTDSVQDASHRAGFFSSRTYNFTFRTALQHVIDEAGEAGLPFNEATARLLEYWSQPVPGRPGSVKEVMAVLMPPDLREYSPWLDFRNNQGNETPPQKLDNEIRNRIAWEVTREFGFMQTHGRTMEPSGCSSLGWDEDVVDATINRLLERLPGISQELAGLPARALKLWIFGILHRYRERGALGHFYLVPYARNGMWGKRPFGRTLPERETYPSAIRYRPRLITTHAQREHENVLSPTTRGNLSPWHIIWTRRALRCPGSDESGLLDLIRALLDEGAIAGLFQRLHQDGGKGYFVINPAVARLNSGGVRFLCGETERQLIRPLTEAPFWDGAPSLEYYADLGRYERGVFSARQFYYQDRYRKGALRRVMASEHTGLLATDERESLERRFKEMEHLDDPNILTCTSTLEMGIDIGDLSSTLLCSIPPSTASYLQRIGRAGRSTGTALIVSVINQRPHDLFFFARPVEMLKGRVEPPGCWLDASAVLVRQYLAYCLDCATKLGILKEIPRSARDLIKDLQHPKGSFPEMLAWCTGEEDVLRRDFLNRFHPHVREDTRGRFMAETRTDMIFQRIRRVTDEFDRFVRDLENARKRLQEQLKALDPTEEDARKEIDQELVLMRGRIAGITSVSALELLTDHGLLPNYAFPERGVKFYGGVYNSHRGGTQEVKPIELSRPAGSALKELAPANYFYTHSREFEIQQIAVGNQQQPLLDKWAICGACGHMRLVKTLGEAGAVSACPQCGHDGDEKSQTDQGQHRFFLEFPRSQAISFMEHYESLSADKSEERKREFYRVIRSFDQTIEAPSGAVGDDLLPFGVEYRTAMLMREVNVGYVNEPVSVPFGPGQSAPDNGFLVCLDCGVVVKANGDREAVSHRRSCSARRKAEKLRQEGKAGDPFRWERVYIHRELRSEAIRLLLPLADDDDLDTLTACIYLGLRLRFEGNPAHLIVTPQVMPEPGAGLQKRYLIIMDAVPGGTGYLKTLYQEKDSSGREGEGIMSVLRLALDTLETCKCRKLIPKEDEEDTDGCYRCIRSYHLQYTADRISRERGIRLLNSLIEAGERRVQKEALAEIKPDALFGSVLEKKFVEALKEYIEERKGDWDTTIIKGGQGYRFAVAGTSRLWELELQPKLGPAHGVMVPSQPDFLLRCSDESVIPVAIFTDGFEYHCHPTNRLADDMKKRRAILESKGYHVWSITWDDVTTATPDHPMVFDPMTAQLVERYASTAGANGMKMPDARLLNRNGMEQLKAFISSPEEAGWSSIARFSLFLPLQMLAKERLVADTELQAALQAWRTGGGLVPFISEEGGVWSYNNRAVLTSDMVTCCHQDDLDANRQVNVHAFARLGDSETEVSGSDFRERWRRFLAYMNLFQFCPKFLMWTSSEAMNDQSPEFSLGAAVLLSPEWEKVRSFITSSLRTHIPALAKAGVPVPEIEFYLDGCEEEVFAELAWPSCVPPIALLAGGQTDYAADWIRCGWHAVTGSDLQENGASWLCDMILNDK
mgnify:CR=1 FL=1